MVQNIFWRLDGHSPDHKCLCYYRSEIHYRSYKIPILNQLTFRSTYLRSILILSSNLTVGLLSLRFRLSFQNARKLIFHHHLHLRRWILLDYSDLCFEIRIGLSISYMLFLCRHLMLPLLMKFSMKSRVSDLQLLKTNEEYSAQSIKQVCVVSLHGPVAFMPLRIWQHKIFCTLWWRK
jgi:hypothetical protein